MNGRDKRYLVDSNILIYHLNGEEIATDFLKENLPYCCISRITFIEVLSFDFSVEDEKNVLSLLNGFEIIETSSSIALQSIKNRKFKKIKLPDNIIAATAQCHKLVLVTRNIKDFENLDLELLNIFDEKNAKR